MDWKDSLATLGYAVVPALTPEEVDFGLKLFHTWHSSNRVPIPPHGVIKHYQVGHTAFAWWCRTRPAILATFSEIWGTTDLIVSFDGACYFPKGLTRRNTNWLHVDQAPKNPNFDCVQGFVAFTENQKACLTLIPGSHLLFWDYMKSNNLYHSTPWQKIHYDFSKTILVPTKPGDLVLWDSRVFHQNSYGSEERLVQYLCYLPRYRATKKDLEKRQKYYQEKRTTSHWPAPIRVNGLQPQVFGRTDKLIKYQELVSTDQGLLKDLDFEIKKLL